VDGNTINLEIPPRHCPETLPKEKPIRGLARLCIKAGNAIRDGWRFEFRIKREGNACPGDFGSAMEIVDVAVGLDIGEAQYRSLLLGDQSLPPVDCQPRKLRRRRGQEERKNFARIRCGSH